MRCFLSAAIVALLAGPASAQNFLWQNTSYYVNGFGYGYGGCAPFRPGYVGYNLGYFAASPWAYSYNSHLAYNSHWGYAGYNPWFFNDYSYTTSSAYWSYRQPYSTFGFGSFNWLDEEDRYYVGGPVVPPPPQVKSLPDDGTARIRIEVPANAEVIVAGTAMKQSGSVREFATPQLNGPAAYDITVRFKANGETVERKVHVPVTPGARAAVRVAS